MSDIAVVFLHGLGSCSFDWELVADCVNVPHVAIDALGHGGRADPVRPSFAALAHQALSAADSSGFDRFVVAGISMGAATALELSSRCPDRVRGALHVAPAWLRAREPENLRRLQKLGRIMRRSGVSRAWALTQAVPPVMHWADADVAAYRRRYLSFDRTSTADWLEGLPAEVPMLDHAALRRVPASVVTWANDPIHPEGLAVEVSRVLQAPFRRLDRPRDRAEEAAVLSSHLIDLVDRAAA